MIRRVAVVCLTMLVAGCASEEPKGVLPKGAMRDVFAGLPTPEAPPPAAQPTADASAGAAGAASATQQPSPRGGVALSLDEPNAAGGEPGKQEATVATAPPGAAAVVASPTASEPVAAPTASPAPVEPATPPPASVPAPSSEPSSTDASWPRMLSADGITIQLDAPQIDAWDGFTLKAHAPVAVLASGQEPSTLGTARLLARTLIGEDKQLIKFRDLEVTDVSFPDESEKTQAYATTVRKAVTRAIKGIAADKLQAQAATIRAREAAGMTPAKGVTPAIVFVKAPALLVSIDGQPRYAKVPGTSLSRVANTGALLFKDPTGKFYLRLSDGYVEAPRLTGPWTVSEAPPKDAAKAEQRVADAKRTDRLAGRPDLTNQDAGVSTQPSAPRIIIATQPTTLIVTRGEPRFALIEGTGLLYLTNTSASVLKSTQDNRVYVLLDGGWLGAASLKGPWESVPGAKLPKDFGRIPYTVAARA